MATNIADLNQFLRWHREGRTILSTSGMRYMPEMRQIAERRDELGELRWLTSFTSKSWERYGIHALETVYPVLGPGFLSVQARQHGGATMAHLAHHSGVQVTLAAVHDAYGSFGAVHAYGTKGDFALKLSSTYIAFRAQLLAFIELLRTSEPPFPFRQTVELMAILIAGIRSRDEGGREVPLREILDQLEAA